MGPRLVISHYNFCCSSMYRVVSLRLHVDDSQQTPAVQDHWLVWPLHDVNSIFCVSLNGLSGEVTSNKWHIYSMWHFLGV